MSLLSRRRVLSSQTGEKYVFVEYIESTGQEWIDTGYMPNGNTTLDIDFQFTSTSTRSAIVGTVGNGKETYQCMYVLQIRNSRYEFSHGAQLNSPFTANVDTERHTIRREKSSVYFDGKITGYPSATFSSPYGLEVFASNNNGAKGTYCSKMKLYSFKLYDNGILVRDFVPCYRKSDKAGGLYDLVEGKFYENQGTGEFLIGGEV